MNWNAINYEEIIKLLNLKHKNLAAVASRLINETYLMFLVQIT